MTSRTAVKFVFRVGYFGPWDLILDETARDYLRSVVHDGEIETVRNNPYEHYFQVTVSRTFCDKLLNREMNAEWPKNEIRPGTNGAPENIRRSDTG